MPRLTLLSQLSNIAWTGLFSKGILSWFTCICVCADVFLNGPKAISWGLGRNQWNEPAIWLVQALKVCCPPSLPNDFFSVWQSMNANSDLLTLVANDRLLDLHYLRDSFQAQLPIPISPNLCHWEQTDDDDMGTRCGHRRRPAVQDGSVFRGRVFLYSG